MTNYVPKFKTNRRKVLKATGAVFAGLTFAPRFALSEEEKKLNLYNYDTYMGETTLDDFNAATGIATRLPRPEEGLADDVRLLSARRNQSDRHANE